jgi:hypothetical protein
MRRLDDARPPWVVVEGAAELADGFGERVRRHCHIAPDEIEQRLMIHQLACVFDQHAEDVKGARLERHHPA